MGKNGLSGVTDGKRIELGRGRCSWSLADMSDYLANPQQYLDRSREQIGKFRERAVADAKELLEPYGDDIRLVMDRSGYHASGLRAIENEIRGRGRFQLHTHHLRDWWEDSRIGEFDHLVDSFGYLHSSGNARELAESVHGGLLYTAGGNVYVHPNLGRKSRNSAIGITVATACGGGIGYFADAANHIQYPDNVSSVAFGGTLLFISGVASLISLLDRTKNPFSELAQRIDESAADYRKQIPLFSHLGLYP